MIPREVVVSASSLHPRGPQYRSRHPIETGAEARGIEAPPRVGGVDMEGVRPGTSGSVYFLRDVSLSTLILPHASSSSWTGCDGADVAEASSVCISLDRSAPGSPGESLPGPGSTTFFAPRWPGRVWLPDTLGVAGPPPELPARRELPVRRDLLSQAGGLEISPPTRTVETVGLTSEGAQLIDSSLSTEVVETILHSRAPSTSKL